MLVSLALVIQSQTYAFVGDESFHLLAAKLVASGKIPYRDFFYQHPPLFVYLIAGIFKIGGVAWRFAHLFSVTSLIGAIVLAALYARDLFSREMRWWNAAIVPVLFGLNCYVLVFATTGLPFGFCLLCLTTALYLSRSTAKAGLYFSGFFAGAALASSFLTLPALPVFAIWLWRRERAKGLWFLLGVTTALLPLLLLVMVAPERTILDVVKYHLVDRPALSWRYDVREIAGWLLSLQGLTLLLASLAAVRLRHDESVRLCGWLALVLTVSLALIKTTTSFYFLLTTPFLAVLASIAIVDLSQQFSRYRALLPALVVVVYLIGLHGLQRVWRSEAPHADYHDVATMVKEVEACAPGGNYYAFEAVYFQSRLLPPQGMENRFDPNSIGDEALREGRFDAVLIGSDNPKVERFGLSKLYARQKSLRLDGYSMLLFCEKVT